MKGEHMNRRSRSFYHNILYGLLLRLSSARKMRIGKIGAVLLTIALTACIGSDTALPLPNATATIGSFGLIDYNVARPLHVEGRFVKDSLNRTIYLRGGWAPIFEDTCNARAAIAGESWNSYLATTKWRPEAVNLLFDTAKSWGFNSIATFIWMDWWIYNSRSELGVSRDTIVTDRPYQTNIDEFLTLAGMKGIYVQLRPYGVEAGWGSVGEGRVNFPFPVLGEPYAHDGHIIPNATAFAEFWYDVSYKLSHHPNVIYNLYDEPYISNRQVWLDAAELAVRRIREAENETGGYKHLIQIHWGWCGSCLWIGDWIDQGKTLDNMIFSNHIYRSQGGGAEDTFGPPPYPYNYSVQKSILQYEANDPGIPDPYKPYGRAWKYVVDTYNVPIIATFGAYQGWSDDQEYKSFQNIASILNEWGIGYWVYVWWRTGTSFSIVNDGVVVSSPSRVGQALIDAIADGKT